LYKDGKKEKSNDYATGEALAMAARDLQSKTGRKSIPLRDLMGAI